jgi:hypothetical protein
MHDKPTHECHVSNKILEKDFNLGACGSYYYVCIPKSKVFTKKYYSFKLFKFTICSYTPLWGHSLQQEINPLCL